MANTKKFNETKALEAIVHVFWQQGFAATSVDDLVAATNVKRQSLYNTFGNKEAMFVAAFAHYIKTATQKLEAKLATCTGGIQQKIHDTLETFANIFQEGNTPAGCFCTNTTAEFSLQTGHFMEDALTKANTGIENTYYTLLKQAQDTGELAQEQSPQALAAFFTVVTRGLAVTSCLKNPQHLQGTIATSLNALRLR